MESKNVILFVWDEENHFKNNINNLGKDSFKEIIRIDSKQTFQDSLELLDDEDYIHLVVHIFYSDKIRGIQNFVGSGIKEKFPKIQTKFISDGTLHRVKADVMLKEFTEDEELYIIKNLQKYHQVRSSIENDEVKVFMKKKLIVNDQIETEDEPSELLPIETITESFKVDYVIITALEEDEMEKVLPLIQEIKEISSGKHLITLGYFKSKPTKKVIYASQLSTGMIDAAILSTELISKYSPKFLIMTGVMGGKPEDTMIGDVVVSKSVFTIDKGKLTEEEFKREIETVTTESRYTTKIKRCKQEIIDFIRDADEIYGRQIKIHFEPVACVRAVIDREGFFKDDILSFDRKTIGLEMEGYGVARACELINNGSTIPLIIKSVMDNTQEKTDDGKKMAAWTSAKVLEYIIKNDII